VHDPAIVLLPSTPALALFLALTTRNRAALLL
jgi:hypothetical protein